MANIELPKDTEGREIPLDTQVLYDSDGTEFFTDKFMYIRVTDEWWFFGHFGSSTSTHQVVATRLHLTPPDSWEKLEEDLDGCIEKDEVCCYYNKNKDCRSCPISGNNPNDCISEVFKDIKERIRNLRGEN